MARVSIDLDLPGNHLRVEEATLADIEGIQRIFQIVYNGNYPFDFGANHEALAAEITDPARYIWLVARNDTQGIVAAMMFSSNARHRMGKAGGAVVLPEYRKLGVAKELLKAGVEHLKAHGVEVIYGTTRSVSAGPTRLVAEVGFKTTGFLPNSLQVEDAEHLNLEVYLTEAALKTRRRKPYLFSPLSALYKVIQSQLHLESAVDVRERAPLILSRQHSPMHLIADAAEAKRRLTQYVSQSRISNHFFPFHEPNWILETEDGGTEFFVYYGGAGRQASIIGYRSDRSDLHNLLDSVARFLEKNGASYVEILVDAYDYLQQQQALSARYIPSAYFPAMKLNIDGKRDDYIVLNRTFRVLDFQDTVVNPEARKYLGVYMAFYNDIYMGDMLAAPRRVGPLRKRKEMISASSPLN